MVANSSKTDYRVDRLWQGVAGVAPWQKLPGQLTDALNVRFDVTLGGAVKRGPTRIVADLDSDSGGAPFDPTATYHIETIQGATILIGNGTVYGFDDTGAPLQVNNLTGNGFGNYIAANAPSMLRDIDTAVSVDTVIVLNRRCPTASNGNGSWSYNQSYRFLIHGNHNTGTETVNVGADVDDYSKLPGSPSDGDVHRAVGDFQLDPAGYYLYYSGTVHANAEGYFPESGNWFRIPRANQNRARYDDDTLPFRIVYDRGAGTLTISRCPWRQRISGNNDTNARMPWTGKRIKGVEFHNSRLFLISDEFVTASRTNDFFNLWNDSVFAIAANDRIAVTIGSRDAGQMLHTCILGQSLMLIAENAQMEFGSGTQALTNVNGRISMITDFRVLDVRPGESAGMVVLVDRFRDVHQYRWGNPDVGIVYTGLLTVHHRKLLFGETVHRIFNIDNTTFITLESGDVLVHDTFMLEGQAVQSAWGRHRLYESALHYDSWRGFIRVVTRQSSSPAKWSILSYVHREEQPPTALIYVPRMDRLQLVASGAMTYDADARETVIPHAGRSGDMDRSCIVVTTQGERMLFVRPARINNDGNPVFDGDWTKSSQWLGFCFDTEIELTKLYPGMTAYGLTLQRLTVFHYESTDYRILVDFGNGETHKQDWQSHRVGVAIVGAPSHSTHYTEFGVHGDARTATIRLASASPGQCAWLGLEYEVSTTGKGRQG